MRIVQQPGAEALTQVGQTISSLVGIGPDSLRKTLLSVAVLLLLWLLRRVTHRLVIARLDDPKARYQWSKTMTYVGFVIAVVVIGQIWLEALEGMYTFLGLLTAGLAIALRDLVTNMAGWAFILLRHPFGTGDRVQVGPHRGDVVDIRLFQFTLLEIGNWVDAEQSTGRLIHVPNSRVFSEPVANYTAEFAYVWHEIPVLVTFESDWRKAKDILSETLESFAAPVAEEAATAVKRASRKFLIFYRTVTPKVYTSVADSGILLTMRFICPVRQRRGLAEQIWEAVLERFGDAPDIDFAYPTTRLYANYVEGKEGARAESPQAFRRLDPEPGDRGG